MTRVYVHRPTGIPMTVLKKLAPRLNTLQGARIGVLDNCKEFSDQVIGTIAEALTRDYGAREVTFWRKGYSGKGAPFLSEMASACDAVLNGVGH